MKRVVHTVPEMFVGLLQHFADHLRMLADDSDCRRRRSNEVLYHQWVEIIDDHGFDHPEGKPVMCAFCCAGSYSERVAKYRAQQTARLINDFIKKEKKGQKDQ